VETEQQPFTEWVIIELLGHRRLAGYLQEVQLAGAGFLRLDIPPAGTDPARTQYIAPGSVYAIHPTTETTARAAAQSWRPEPVSRWEIRALEKADDDAWRDDIEEEYEPLNHPDRNPEQPAEPATDDAPVSLCGCGKTAIAWGACADHQDYERGDATIIADPEALAREAGERAKQAADAVAQHQRRRHPIFGQ